MWLQTSKVVAESGLGPLHFEMYYLLLYATTAHYKLSWIELTLIKVRGRPPHTASPHAHTTCATWQHRCTCKHSQH
jgi:hypothetical protein